MMFSKKVLLLLSCACTLLSGYAQDQDNSKRVSSLRGESTSRSLQSCDVEAEVVCKIRNTETSCADIGTIQRGQTCGDIPVKLRYNIRNNMSKPIVFRQEDGQTIAKYRNQEIPDIDKAPLEAYGFRMSQKYDFTINTCQTNVLRASFKVEGWIQGSVGTRDAYCYGWDFVDVKTGTYAPTLEPSSSPTSFPSLAPSSFPSWSPSLISSSSPSLLRSSVPTSAPVPEPIEDALPPPPSEPMISVDIECFVQGPDRSFDVKCEDMNTAANAEDCSQIFKYVYTVTNLSPSDNVLVQGLVLQHANEAQVALPLDDIVEVAPSLSFAFDDEKIKNVCTLSGESVETRIVAIGADPVGGSSVSASDTHTLTLPDIPLQWEMDETVECYTDDGLFLTTCNKYINTITTVDECWTEVVFTYTIRNTGISCENVDTIDARIGTGPGRVLAIDESHACSSRLFCPDQVWTLHDYRTIDVCDNAGSELNFELTLDDDSTDDGTYTFENLPPFFDPEDPTDPDGDGDGDEDEDELPDSSTPSPTSSPTPDSTLTNVGVECTDRPSVMYFSFSGGICSDSTTTLGNHRKLTSKSNSGGSGGSGYFTCQDFQEVENPSTIIITNNGGDVYFDDSIRFGEEILAIPPSGDVDSYLNVAIVRPDGLEAQSFTFHSSCSKPILTGDTFGALTLIGYRNDEQGLVKIGV